MRDYLVHASGVLGQRLKISFQVRRGGREMCCHQSIRKADCAFRLKGVCGYMNCGQKYIILDIPLAPKKKYQKEKERGRDVSLKHKK